MAPTLVPRLTTLLGVSPEVIQQYCKTQRRLIFRVARKKARLGLEVERSRARLMTLNAEATFPSTEEVEVPKTDENEIYAQWRKASDEERKELLGRLFGEVRKHVEAVMWLTIHEAHKELTHDIATVVIESLAKFEGKSKFSTRVQKLIMNQCYQYLRQKGIQKKRCYVSESPEYDINLRDARAEAAFVRVEEGVDAKPLERLINTLPKKDYVLLQCKLEGMTIAEAAKDLGDSEDAAESRWRRLKGRLRKQIQESPDGK